MVETTNKVMQNRPLWNQPAIPQSGQAAAWTVASPVSTQLSMAWNDSVQTYPTRPSLCLCAGTVC